MIPTSPAEDRAVKAFIDQAMSATQEYNLFTHNCADFVREALAAGGIKLPDVATPNEMMNNAVVEADRRRAAGDRESPLITRAFIAIMAPPKR